MFELYRHRTLETSDVLKQKLCALLLENNNRSFDDPTRVVDAAVTEAENWLVSRKRALGLRVNNINQPIRTNGEAYVNHAIRTALILCGNRLSISESVVSAALLHDVATETGYSLDAISDVFGEDTAKLVESVIFVSKSEISYINAVANDESYNKNLGAYASQFSQWALLIKFAARFDELVTINALEEHKQTALVNDTKTFLLPLMRHTDASLFAEAVQEEIFRIEQRLRKKHAFTDHYETLRAKFEEMNTEPWINGVTERLNTVFVFDELGVPFIERPLFESFIRLPNYMYRAYEMLKERRIADTSDATPSVFVNRIIAITSLRRHNDNAAAIALYTAFSEQNRLKDLHVTGIGQDVLYFRDEYLNEYEIRTVPKENIGEFLFGQLGPASVKTYESDIEVFNEKNISVTLPARSTVIDYAFTVEPERAVMLTGVKINDVDASIFMTLENNQRITLSFDKRPQAAVQWLYYCTLPAARMEMIEYFGRIIAALRAALQNADSSDDENERNFIDAEPLKKLMFNYEPQITSADEAPET